MNKSSTILSLHDKLLRLERNDIVNVQAGRPIQLSVFEEQQISEKQIRTTTVRINVDLMERIKQLARKHKIKNHGKLMNVLLDEVLIKLEDPN